MTRTFIRTIKGRWRILRFLRLAVKILKCDTMVRREVRVVQVIEQTFLKLSIMIVPIKSVDKYGRQP